MAGTVPTNPLSVFGVLGVKSAGSSNLVVFYGSPSTGVATDFGMLRGDRPDQLVRLPGVVIPRHDTGTNRWWDEAPPAAGPVFYQPYVP